MNKVLVKFSRDWADEFDVEGFAIFTKKEWEDAVEKFESEKYHVSYFFGTNEGWEDEIDSDWLDNYNVTEITDEEYTIIENLFGVEYGVFPNLLDLICYE